MFFGFLDQAGAHAGALFLLGDIFDVWIGDDSTDNPPAWLAQALQHLKQTSQRVPLFIGHGNRDFLMGLTLAQHIGARLLDEHCLLHTQGQTVLLAHGDEFCTTDRAYQRFRKLVRNPWVQKLYLSLSLKQRLAIAQRARQKSMQSQAKPQSVWHDVALSSIDQALVSTGTRTVVHGHTHKPGHYVDVFDERAIDRWVLPDWEADHLKASELARGGWIVINANGISLFDVSGKSLSEDKVSHH